MQFVVLQCAISETASVSVAAAVRWRCKFACVLTPKTSCRMLPFKVYGDLVYPMHTINRALLLLMDNAGGSSAI